MQELDMKEIAIIDALPAYDYEKTILNVGCGFGKMDFHLARMGYRVYATDIKRHSSWQDGELLTFYAADIFDLTSFSVFSASVVICSQVLEHLRDYKKALINLLRLAETRLIITFPYKYSFRHPEHVNFWADEETSEFRCVDEFIELCKPYSVAISKIISKSQDIRKQFAYLTVVDKRQKIR